MKKNCVANEILRPVINMLNVRSHTCLSQPYREKASTMLMVAPVVKNWMEGMGLDIDTGLNVTWKRGDYCRGHHEPVVDLSVAQDPHSDIETQGKGYNGEDEGDEPGNDEVRAPGLRADVVGFRPCRDDLGRRRPHVVVWRDCLSGGGAELATFEADRHCGHAVAGCKAHLGRWCGSSAGRTGRLTWTGQLGGTSGVAKGIYSYYVSYGPGLREQSTSSGVLAYLPIGESAMG